MSISIHKVLTVQVDPGFTDGTRIAQFVLDDGATKRVTLLGHLPNNNAQARAAILARGQELFDKGKRWYADQTTNIESPVKDFLDNLPDLATANAAVDNISNLADAKVYLKKLNKVILALNEMRN